MLPALLLTATMKSCLFYFAAGIPICGSRTDISNSSNSSGENVAVAESVDYPPPGTAISNVGSSGFFRVQPRYGLENDWYVNDERGMVDTWDIPQIAWIWEDAWSSYWDFTRESNGEYRIVNRWTGKRMTVQDVTGHMQVQLWTDAEIAKLRAQDAVAADAARRANYPVPSPTIRATTFQLEPRNIGGVPCFRINWSGGGMSLNNEYWQSGSVEVKTPSPTWWSACWVLRTYPRF